MYNERNRAADIMKGDPSDAKQRQIIRLLEEMRADIKVLRQQIKEENA